MQIWGKHMVLNLIKCDSYAIRDKDTILEWGKTLIKNIDMKSYGKPIIERFALDNPESAGYTYLQMIETSNISAHFAEKSNNVFIDIFSCKDYDNHIVIDTCKYFFNFIDCKYIILNRMIDGRIIQDET